MLVLFFQSNRDRLNKSPPNSPPSYRRTVSRDENVFSRLTSSTTQSIEHHRSKGVIQPYQGKVSIYCNLTLYLTENFLCRFRLP